MRSTIRCPQALAAALTAYCDIVAAQAGKTLTSDQAAILETLARSL